MSALRNFKELVQRCANKFGYQIERLQEPLSGAAPPIDVLDLLLTKLSIERPDFFFIQIGANDGITDDPIHRYVTRHHWRGLLVEPQPEVFRKLTKNYAGETQLLFENVAISDEDGVAHLFVADHRDEAANLTVFATLKKDALTAALVHSPRADGVGAHIGNLEVPALSVRTLLSRHGVTKLDFLQIDAQGYDGQIVGQFLDDAMLPSIIHFEHCYIAPATLRKLYGRLAQAGYHLGTFENDAIAYLPDERLEHPHLPPKKG